MTRILRINMSTLSAKIEDLPEAYQGLGGRGLTSRIVSDEVKPTCDPLGPENRLVFAAGLLAGTMVPNTGRLSVGAKSPLTGTIKEANAGGSAAQKMARLTFRAVIVEGTASELTTVRIDKNGATFLPAASFTGMGNYAFVDTVKSSHGDDVSVISIGPAGEKRLTAASIAVTSRDFHLRIAGRGGLGAVMGSKNLKALIIDDSDGSPVKAKDEQKLRESTKLLSKGIAANGFVGALKQFGTPVIVMVTNTVGALPTKNYSVGQFEKAETICGEYMHELLKARPNAKAEHRCMDGCIVGCSNIYTDKKGEVIVSGLEYETIALAGSNCMIGDLDVIARINRACNDAGVDTMDVGGAIAVAMEAGVLPWGDGEGALDLIKEIAQGTDKGVMIGNGVRFTGRKLEARRVPHAKGQGLSGYDPRILKGIGVTYATSPMGADHTAGIVLPGESDPSYVPVTPTGQGPKSQFMQAHMAAVDTLGLCMMAGMPVLETPGLLTHLTGCVSAFLGQALPEDFLEKLGLAVLKTERAFNDAAGFTEKDDRLPAFFSKEGMSPAGFVFDVPEEEIDKVNRF